MSVAIGGRLIGEDCSALIVAEIGPNHNGSSAVAKRLIDAAKESGCGAVKFQYHLAEAEIHDKKSQSYFYNESRYEFIKRVQEFPHEVHQSLREYTNQQGLLYVCSVFSEEAVEWVADLQPDAYKIPSGEISNPWIMEALSEVQAPVISSTGMSPISEIDGMMEKLTVRGRKPVLLHCVSEYPTELQHMNLRMIPILRDRYLCPVGLSDHSRRFDEISASVALGVSIIEVHFTFDREAKGPDHHISVTPGEMTELVERIRNLEAALGEKRKILGMHVDSMRDVFTNSIVARRHITEGEILSRQNLALKKPGLGLSPNKLSSVVGRTSRKNIDMNQLIRLEDIE
jgi:sialic acid synthase SpsE